MIKVLKSIDKRKKFEIFQKKRYKHFFWLQHHDQGFKIDW